MRRRWVVNSSPLILLGKVEQIPLLGGLAEEIVVPREVVREVDVKPDGAKIREQLDALDVARIESGLLVPSHVSAWDLGSGESAVLTHAEQIGESRAVLDDLDARRCAKALGVPVIGTLGVVLRAKRLGLIDAARPIISALRTVGLYVSDDLIQSVLARLKE